MRRLRNEGCLAQSGRLAEEVQQHLCILFDFETCIRRLLSFPFRF